MAINLTYDPSNDPAAIEAQDAIDAESLAIGERLEQEQEMLLAGKYKDARELEQAYIELQKKLGQKGQDNEDDQPEETEVDDTQEDEVNDDPQVAFVADAMDEYDKTGELSEETIAAFSQMSSQELVDAYMRLQQQMPEQEYVQPTTELTAQQVNQIQNSVGGEAAYQQLVGWAAENFAPAEIEAFDAVVESGNIGAIGLALQALYYRYTDAMGYEGQMIQGKPARSMDVFRSQAEVVRAMSDPRYENDPAYRQDIFDKLDRSDLEF